MKLETVKQRSDRKYRNIIDTWPRKEQNGTDSCKATRKGACHRLPKKLYWRIHGLPEALRPAVEGE